MAYYPGGGYQYAGYPPYHSSPNSGAGGQPQHNGGPSYHQPPPYASDPSNASASIPTHEYASFQTGTQWPSVPPIATWPSPHSYPNSYQSSPISTSTLSPLNPATPSQTGLKFKNSNKILLRLGLHGFHLIALFAFLNLVIILPAKQSEIGFSDAAKQVFNSAIILLSLLIARAVKNFYEECAKAVRWSFLRSAHTYEDTLRLLEMESFPSSFSIIWSYLRGRSRYRRTSEVLLVFVLLVVATVNELGIALLGFTFQIDDKSYLETGNVAWQTDWRFIGYNTEYSNQLLTARTNGVMFLNLYGTMENPLNMTGRGLQWNQDKPTEYLYDLLEWDTQGSATRPRPSRWPQIRNTTIIGQCDEARDFALSQNETGCFFGYLGHGGEQVSHHVDKFDCMTSDTIFFHDIKGCGSRCATTLVLEGFTAESTSSKLFTCNVTVGETLGVQDPKGLIKDETAKIFASSLAYGSYRAATQNATISRIGTLPLPSVLTPYFSFQDFSPRPFKNLNMTDAQWVAAILARFTTASISTTDGSNLRFQSLGKTQISLDRLQSNVEFLNGIIAGVGLLIFLTLVSIAYLISDMEIPDDKPDNIAIMVSSISGDVEVRTEKTKPTIRYVSGTGLRFLTL